MRRPLGVTMELHGKVLEVVQFYRESNWLLLVEAVTLGNGVALNENLKP